MIKTKEELDRTKFIGGSEAASILGLSRYGTPLGVWARKCGQIEHADISDELPVKLGIMLEDTVVKLFEEETGKVVMPAVPEMFQGHKIIESTDEKTKQTYLTIFHKQYDFIAGTPDRIIPAENAGFEAKTTNSYKQKDWESGDEDIPVEYQLQCLHYLAVTGLSRWYIACLIGNRKFVWRVIERNDKVLEDLIRKEVNFWQKFVVPKVMPAVTADDGGLLSRLFPIAAEESVIELGDDFNRAVESLDSMQADYNQLEAQIEQTKNEIKTMLKTFEKGRSNRFEVTWKNQADNRIDTKKLKLEEPAIYEKYLNTKPKRVFRYKVLR